MAHDGLIAADCVLALGPLIDYSTLVVQSNQMFTSVKEKKEEKSETKRKTRK